MIVGRCNSCNYVARYSSNYFSISELQRHSNLETAIEQDQCIHDLKYEEDKSEVIITAHAITAQKKKNLRFSDC